MQYALIFATTYVFLVFKLLSDGWDEIGLLVVNHRRLRFLAMRYFGTYLLEFFFLQYLERIRISDRSFRLHCRLWNYDQTGLFLQASIVLFNYIILPVLETVTHLMLGEWIGYLSCRANRSWQPIHFWMAHQIVCCACFWCLAAEFVLDSFEKTKDSDIGLQARRTRGSFQWDWIRHVEKVSEVSL